MKAYRCIDVAKELGVSRQYIARLCAAGRVPGAWQHGRYWVIPERGLAALRKTKEGK